MKLISITSCFLCFTTLAGAQQNLGQHVKRTFIHSHGVAFQEFANLNRRIAEFPDYEKTKATTGTFQLGLVAERKKLVFVYSYNSGNSLSGYKNKNSSATKFWGFSADIGYHLLKTDRVTFYPFVGLGYEKFKLTFNKDISTIRFDSVFLSNNSIQKTENIILTNSFVVYRTGMSLSIQSKKRPGNSIGLQIGYTGSFREEEWKINNSQTLLNSPKDNLSKMTASLLICWEIMPGNKHAMHH